MLVSKEFYLNVYKNKSTILKKHIDHIDAVSSSFEFYRYWMFKKCCMFLFNDKILYTCNFVNWCALIKIENVFVDVLLSEITVINEIGYFPIHSSDLVSGLCVNYNYFKSCKLNTCDFVNYCTCDLYVE